MNKNSSEIKSLTIFSNKIEAELDDTTKLMGKSILEINNSIKDYINTSDELKKLSKEILSLNNLSSENARSVEEIASAADHLNSLTSHLQSQLNSFKTN